MINPGYKITPKEENELKSFRNSKAYGTYLKTISESPAFISIMRDNIQNINIEPELKILQKENKLPSGVNSKVLNALFKEALNKMAIGLVADSIILKELEDLRVSDVLNDIRTESDIIYLLGAAEEKYYDHAKQLLAQDKLDIGSAAFQGLVAFLKKNKEDTTNIMDNLYKKQEEYVRQDEEEEESDNIQNIDSNDIIL